MRKSSIQVMRQSRRSSLDHSASFVTDRSFDRFQKTKFGQRLTLNELVRVTTQKVLDKMGQEKVEYEPATPLWTQPHIPEGKKLNIPEYEFLKSKEQIETDPFLKAKMKYLVTKQRPQLIKQMPKMKLPHTQKRNTQNIENQTISFTTLKKQQTKQNKKKLFLLTVGNHNIKK